MTSRRNVFSRGASGGGGMFLSPRSDLRKQASLRNAFQRGSLKNMQGSLRNVFSKSPKGGKRGSTDTGRAVVAAAALPPVEERSGSVSGNGNGIKLRNLRGSDSDTSKGKAEKKKRTVRKEKSPSSGRDKVSRDGGGGGKPKPKKTKSSSSNNNNNKKKKTKKDCAGKKTKSRRSKIGARPAQQFPPLAPSPRSLAAAKKRVKVDMAGQINNLDLTASSLTEHTHTEATHDMWLCPSPGASPAVSLRKIPLASSAAATTEQKQEPQQQQQQQQQEVSSSSPLPPATPTRTPAREVCRGGGLSPAAKTRASHATSASNRTSDDDISILSEEDYSEQIMEDLSCVLDCDEENDFVSHGDGGDEYWDEELDEEEEILEDEELYDEEDDDGARSYVDLYCSPRNMKRISDLTGATGAFTMSSVMYDDDDAVDCHPRYPTVYVPPSSRSDADLRGGGGGKRRSSVNSTNNNRRRASMSRISELTEVTMYELENFDYEDDENYDCSSIVSSDSSSFVVPNRKPMTYYSTSGKHQSGPGEQQRPADQSGVAVVSDQDNDNGDSSTLSSSFGRYRKPISFYSTSEKQDNPFVVSPIESKDEPPKSPARISRKTFDNNAGGGGNLPPRYPLDGH